MRISQLFLRDIAQQRHKTIAGLPAMERESEKEEERTKDRETDRRREQQIWSEEVGRGGERHR